jgi:hypothetical protein
MTQPKSTAQYFDESADRDVIAVHSEARQLVLKSYEASVITFDEYAQRIIDMVEHPDEQKRRKAVGRRRLFLKDAQSPLVVAAFEATHKEEICDRALGEERDNIDLSDNPAKRIWGELAVLYRGPATRWTEPVKPPKEPEAPEPEPQPAPKPQVIDLSGKRSGKMERFRKEVDEAEQDSQKPPPPEKPKLPPPVPEDKPGELYRELLKEGDDINQFWATVEEELQACNEVLVWPTVIETSDGEKELQHKYACGDTFSLVTTEADRSLIECIVIHDEWEDEKGRIQKKWKLWTDKWHGVFTYDEEGNLIRTDQVRDDLKEVDEDPAEDENSRNPYGRLIHHLVRRRKWQDKLTDTTSGEDLVSGTIRAGVARQDFRYKQKMSGWKQIVVTGNADALPEQLLDPGVILRIPGHDVDATVVDWDMNLKEEQEVMERDELRLASSRGINPENYKSTANYQGGQATRRAERPLKELRVRMAPTFWKAESTHGGNVCLVAQAHALVDEDNIPDHAYIRKQLQTQHAPIDYADDPKDQVSLEKEELGMMLTDHVELMQRRYPELSQAQALSRLRRHGRIIAEIQRLKTTHNIANNPATESASAEANGEEGPIVRDSATPPGSPPGKPSGE